MKKITPFEALIDIILMVINPEQYHAGKKAREGILDKEKRFLPVKDLKLAQAWPSVFTGISVISNRETPAHRDRGSSFQDYDLLNSLGTHKRSSLVIHDVGRSYAYHPGVAVALCGKVFQHSVPGWVGGERVCYAHFMKDKVLEKLGCDSRSWPTLDAFV